MCVQIKHTLFIILVLLSYNMVKDWFEKPKKSLEDVIEEHTQAQLNFMQRQAKKY